MNKLIQFFINLGSPRRFYHFCGKILPFSFALSLFAIGYGVIGGLFLAPPDYQQGEGFRIIYVHVPCAFLSLTIYMTMAIGSAIHLIWRIKIADLVAYSLAPLGALFTACALITGSLWGKPMWGTWWIWDARLTSELILLFLYLGYIGLYQAISNKKMAAQVCAILAIIGAIDIPIIHYSVYWWNTLHQGSTLGFSKSSIDPSMIKPLLAMMIGFALYAVAISCVRIRSEILKRGSSQQWIIALLRKSDQKGVGHGSA